MTYGVDIDSYCPNARICLIHTGPPYDPLFDFDQMASRLERRWRARKTLRAVASPAPPLDWKGPFEGCGAAIHRPIDAVRRGPLFSARADPDAINMTFSRAIGINRPVRESIRVNGHVHNDQGARRRDLDKYRR